MPVDPLENFINDRRADFDRELPAGLWDKIADDLGEDEGQDDDDSDSLRSFVQRNRQAFDEAEPPAAAWNNILADLPADQSSGNSARIVSFRAKRGPSVWYRAAAAAVILLVAGAMYLGRQMGYQDARDQQMAVINAIAPEFQDTQLYYEDEISNKIRQVSNYNDDPQLFADLETIDRSMKELREEILRVPREERAKLVTDLIKSYQIKLNILENILRQLPAEADADTNDSAKPSTIEL